MYVKLLIGKTKHQQVDNLVSFTALYNIFLPSVNKKF